MHKRSAIIRKTHLGLFCLVFLLSRPHLAAQAIQEIPSTGPEESLHEEQAAPATTPEAVPGTAPAATVSAVPETVPTSIPEQGLFTEFFLPPAREGMGAESWYYEAKRLEQADQGGAPSQEKQALLDHMYSLAFHFGEKNRRHRSGENPAATLLYPDGLPRYQNLALQWLEYFGPDWEVYRILISRALGRRIIPQALEAVAAMSGSCLPPPRQGRPSFLFTSFPPGRDWASRLELRSPRVSRRRHAGQLGGEVATPGRGGRVAGA